jgi:glutamyl-tRNA synthetase
MVPYLQAGGVLPAEVTEVQRDLLRAAAPLVQERMTVLGEAVEMLGFLFVEEGSFTRDADDVARVLDANDQAVVKAAYDGLADLDGWDTASIEQALRGALVEGLGLKPRNAFGPVRVAITGRRVSPPLFESLELLGRERSLERLRSAGHLER